MRIEQEEAIDTMFDNYLADGLDFSSRDTLEDIFRKIFKDAVNATINIYEGEEE